MSTKHLLIYYLKITHVAPATAGATREDSPPMVRCDARMRIASQLLNHLCNSALVPVQNKLVQAHQVTHINYLKQDLKSQLSAP